MQDRIDHDLATAMKERIASRVAVLRLLKNALKNEQIKTRHELSEQESVKVLQREAKQRRDSIAAYEQAAREELAEAERMELEVINEYLPAQMSEADLSKLIDTVIEETGAKSPAEMGVVMGRVMGLTAGQADGQTVARIVQERLKP